MNFKKFAFVLEWVGVVIVLAGAIELALNYFGIIELPFRFDSFMLFILGAVLLCFVPHKIIKYKEVEKQNGQPNHAGKRSVFVNIIAAIVLIVYGFIKLGETQI